MSHKTETGEWPSIHADNSSSVSVLLKKISNEPLPWFGMFALIVVFLTAQSYQAKERSEQAKNSAWEAETQALMLREHVDQLRFELASHGIKPPDYPTKLKVSP